MKRLQPARLEVISFLAWAAVGACHRDREIITGGGADRFESSACTWTDPARTSCGGNLTTTGGTPLGNFAPNVVFPTLSRTCANLSAYAFQIDLTNMTTADFARINLADASEGGVAPFLGTHPASAVFGIRAACGTATTTGTIDLMAGDDPATAFAQQSGMLSGTFSFTNDGFTFSGSFQSPYCLVADCQN